MKSAFVTGAATGIGEALVVRLQHEGWRVFASYRSTPPEKARWWGLSNVTAVHCDVAEPDELRAAGETTREATSGTLDLLVNNAGYAGSAGVIEAADMNEYRRMFEVNFWGPMQLTQVMMPMLRRSKGRVINVTSASVYLTIPVGSAYVVSKVALKSLTQHLRLEMAPFGVQVTSLEPGGVDTPMTDFTPELGEQQWNSIPQALRGQYRQHFRDGGSVIGENFTLIEPDEFADRVWRKIITAKRLKPSYLIGPKVAPLPWMHRLLPAQQVQNIWARMFKAQPAK